MPGINKILIANRGEIALRIIRTCRDLGIESVAVYSRPDEESPHVLYADESVFIGEAASAESYLSVDRIMEAVHASGADAVHPGYGFLSENAGFARRCEEEGKIFIGPGHNAIELMGDKTRARLLMNQAGVPTPPGSPESLKSSDEARRIADEIGYPILIKAAAGGGGKGMRVVTNSEELDTAFRSARSEAGNAFGDERVYIEKYLQSPRHVEFQIMADKHGHTVHLFDRECSVQRRHQKVIEEAPCTILEEDLRADMARAAVAAADACGYTGAGTVEFLVDAGKNFYFLEMNTRLQVEHPVTEWITGLDLVELQIRVAEGEKLPFTQDEVPMNGHSIECRIYAEDPDNRFLPSTGRLTRHRPPSGAWVRVDAGVEEGSEITISYDPMISKLSVHAPDRQQAIRRMLRALDEYEISGCRTTIPFCRFVLEHPSFISGNYDTNFVSRYFDPEMMKPEGAGPRALQALVAALIKTDRVSSRNLHERDNANPQTVNSDWWRHRREKGRREL